MSVAFSVILLTVAGCGTAPASAPSHPNALTIATPPDTTVSWWPPLITAVNCGTVAGGLGDGLWGYMPLLYYNSNDTINWQTSIADSISHNAADTQYVVHLNPKWHWSNGQPVTAQDVVYDYELEAAASNPNAPLFFCDANAGGLPQLWKSVTATSEYTVTIDISKPVNPTWLIDNGIAQLLPVPKNLWDRYANMTQELSWMKSIGNSPYNKIYQVTDAPYKFKKLVTNEYWEFVANPHYDGPVKPIIKTIIYDYETSTANIFAQLKKGDVQEAVYSNSMWPDRSQLKNDVVESTPFFGFSYALLNFNPRAPVGTLFHNLYIRQALQYGINQPLIVNKFYHGHAVPSYGPVPAQADVYNRSLGNLYPFDPAKGKALLEAHGWHMVNGVMEKNGQKLAFTADLFAGSPTLADIAEYEKSVWASEGIDVTLKELAEMPFLGDAALANEWSMVLGFGWLYGPPYDPSGDGLFSTGGGYNYDYYSSPTMNTLIAKTTEPASLAGTIQAFHQYQRFAFENLPVLYFPDGNLLTAVSTQLGGWAAAHDNMYYGTNDQGLFWK